MNVAKLNIFMDDCLSPDFLQSHMGVEPGISKIPAKLVQEDEIVCWDCMLRFMAMRKHHHMCGDANG